MNEYSQMVSDLAKPGADIIKTLTPESAHMLHMAIGLSGEVSELKDAHLNQLHEDITIGERELIIENVIEELGDIEFYFEGLCQSMGVTIEQSSSGKSNILSIDKLIVNVGLMLDIVKKMVIYNKEVALMEFVNQLITIRVTLDLTYTYFGTSQKVALEHNMNKLLKGKTARYKEGSYSDSAAQLRSDKEA